MPAPDLDSPKYIVVFTVALCGVCAVFVSSAAVGLADRQALNERVDRQAKVLTVAGLMKPGEALPAEQVLARFEEQVVARVIDLDTGAYVDDADATTFDQRAASRDPERSRPAPDNAARVQRVPRRALVYHVGAEGAVDRIIVPISGYGLWSTMYGFLALNADGVTIEGITFYEHGETPGLGGEIENPRWQALWRGRKVYDDTGKVALEVVKGAAKPASEAPHQVDGISGATITSRGVTATIEFWLGPHGFGPYLEKRSAS
jgi:Na+-transporting NADH:ubiquinone oxidoreductase subunit C